MAKIILIIILTSLFPFKFLIGQISTTDLIAYYSFDGDVLDRSPNEYHCTLIGGTYTSDWQGNANSALRLNGISDYVNLTALHETFKNNLDEITIYFLVKFESNKPSQTIISLGNSGESLSNNVFEIEFEHDRFQLETETGTNAINHEHVIDQEQNVVDQEWHQIMIRLNQDSLTYCRDNQLIFKGTYTPAETTTNELFVGCFDGNNATNKCCFFDGVIDELQIYKTLTLEVSDTITYEGCRSDDLQVVVNGAMYDADNPSGMELVKSNCCLDTLYEIGLVFHEEYYSEINEAHCENSNYSVEVNNVIYDINNPSGIELMQTVDQCDSIVSVDIVFTDQLEFDVIESSCEDEGKFYVINGTVYDQSNLQELR